jgi:alkylated DNA nucleotide flippase Atl1
MYRKKTFREKLQDDKGFPRVERLTGGMRRRFGAGTILLPAPSEVEELMRRVPKGKVVTINEIRETLASRHGATMACPIVTGILARLVAGAAGEDEAAGRKRVTPYWRTLKAGGELNPKYPGGLEGQRRHLEAEGHRVRSRGARLFVEL